MICEGRESERERRAQSATLTVVAVETDATKLQFGLEVCCCAVDESNNICCFCYFVVHAATSAAATAITTMNTRRSTGSIKTSKRSISRLYVATLTTKTITPELHAVNAKICRLVEQHPCMYDRSHAAYMRKSHVEQAWVEISKQMNDTGNCRLCLINVVVSNYLFAVDNCKERFRNIRTSFARSINVQRGSNRVKPYYLSEELEFLKKHITPGVPVPVKGRRSRDSSNRRGDENDEYDDNDDEDHVRALVHIKHSLSSDEHEHENSTDSSEWVADEHAQELLASQLQNKPEAEFYSQSDENEQKPKNLLQPNAVPQTCPCPPKKRRRIVAELAKPNDVSI